MVKGRLFRTENPCVRSSILRLGTIFYAQKKAGAAGPLSYNAFYPESSIYDN